MQADQLPDVEAGALTLGHVGRDVGKLVPDGRQVVGAEAGHGDAAVVTAVLAQQVDHGAGDRGRALGLQLDDQVGVGIALEYLAEGRDAEALPPEGVVAVGSLEVPPGVECLQLLDGQIADRAGAGGGAVDGAVVD